MTNTTAHERQTIVVGVDGSEGSDEALAWAAEQAALTDARLAVVAAWDYPVTFGWPPAPFAPSGVDLETNARDELARSIKKVLGETPGIEVVETVIEGPPRLVLTQHSADAALLVVGRRGLGAIRGMLLGSVSAYAATHARCPVAIVNHHDAHDTEPEPET